MHPLEKKIDEEGYEEVYKSPGKTYYKKGKDVIVCDYFKGTYFRFTSKYEKEAKENE